MTDNRMLLISLILAFILGGVVGWIIRTPEVKTEYITNTIEIPVPAVSSSGTGKPIIQYVPVTKPVPFNPDSLELDSLRAIARIFEDIQYDFLTYREDSLVQLWIASFPLTRTTKDSLVIKPRTVTYQDTTQINTTEISSLKWWHYPVGAIILVLTFLAGGSR